MEFTRNLIFAKLKTKELRSKDYGLSKTTT